MSGGRLRNMSGHVKHFLNWKVFRVGGMSTNMEVFVSLTRTKKAG